MIEPEHPALPITRQCELLELARTSYYHEPDRIRTRTCNSCG